MPEFDSTTVGLPIKEIEEMATGLRYIVDTNGPIVTSFVQYRDATIYLEMIFDIAGVKVPADDPRGPGDPVKKAVLPMIRPESEHKALLPIREGIEVHGSFSGGSEEDLQQGSFILRIPMEKAVIRDWLEPTKPDTQG